MPRMPIASFEAYEEPVVASDVSARSPSKSTRRFNLPSPTTATATTAAAAPPSPSSQEARQAGPLPSLKRGEQPRPNHFAEESLSSLKLGRAQRADEYPRMAFKPRRELRQAAEESRRGSPPAKAAHNFVFGLGSHGLYDHACERGGGVDGDLDHMKASTTQSHYPPLVGSERSVSKQPKHDAPSTTRLPALPPSRMAVSGQTTMSQTKRTAPPLSTSAALPNAPRMLRYGGVIDTFSYFSVHRVHPELYAR